MCIRNCFILIFLILSKTCIFWRDQSQVISSKRLTKTSIWQVHVHFRVVYCENFLNIGRQNGVTWKDLIDIKFSSVTPCDMYLSQFDFSQQIFFDNWWDDNHISDHGFKCLLGSAISTEKFECLNVLGSFASSLCLLCFQWTVRMYERRLIHNCLSIKSCCRRIITLLDTDDFKIVDRIFIAKLHALYYFDDNLSCCEKLLKIRK